MSSRVIGSTERLDCCASSAVIEWISSEVRRRWRTPRIGA
jgi:hypothetical protein